MSASKKKKERKELATQGLSERQKQELREAAKRKQRTVIYSVVGAIIALLVIALLVWNSGIVQGNSTALTVGDEKFTPADVNYYYYLALNNAWYNEQLMKSYYEAAGLEYEISFDPQSDLKTQYVDAEKTQSYHDAFMESARNSLKFVVARYNAAVAEGFALSDEDKESIEKNLADLRDSAASVGYTVPNYLRALYGRYMTEKTYRRNLERSTLAGSYDTAMTADFGDYTDEELMAYYEENPDNLDTYYYNVAYINGTAPNPTDENGEEIVDAAGNTVTATDAENEAAHEKARESAEAMVAALRDGAVFGEIAFEYVDESESLSYMTEGYTEAATTGSSLSSAPYGTWMMDPARKDGDIELFDASHGYYVIRYQKRELVNTPTVDFRHILFQAENGEDGPSDADLLTANQKADAALRAFNAAGTEQTAARFGEIADRLTEDSGSKGKGGLYEKTEKGSMVTEIDTWIFDAARQPGDVVILEHVDPAHYSGVHVVYFVGSNEPVWKATAESGLKTAESEAWSEAIESGYTVTDGPGMKYVA